jgi:hypothetical protein
MHAHFEPVSANRGADTARPVAARIPASARCHAGAPWRSSWWKRCRPPTRAHRKWCDTSRSIVCATPGRRHAAGNPFRRRRPPGVPPAGETIRLVRSSFHWSIALRISLRGCPSATQSATLKWTAIPVKRIVALVKSASATPASHHRCVLAARLAAFFELAFTGRRRRQCARDELSGGCHNVYSPR